MGYDYKAINTPAANDITHHGVKGQKWGRRRWQNEDGSLTPEGYLHYYGKAAGHKAGTGFGSNLNKSGKVGRAVGVGIGDVTGYYAGLAIAKKRGYSSNSFEASMYALAGGTIGDLIGAGLGQSLGEKRNASAGKKAIKAGDIKTASKKILESPDFAKFFAKKGEGAALAARILKEKTENGKLSEDTIKTADLFGKVIVNNYMARNKIDPSKDTYNDIKKEVSKDIQELNMLGEKKKEKLYETAKGKKKKTNNKRTVAKHGYYTFDFPDGQRIVTSRGRGALDKSMIERANKVGAKITYHN